MTTTIALPDPLFEQLERRAIEQQRSVEALAIEYTAAALTEEAAPSTIDIPAPEDDPELLALVARIKAMPKDPQNIIPAKGNLAEVLRALESADAEVDIEAESADLRRAEEELNAINQADAHAEGYGKP